jgi:phage terminase small subunit
MPILENNRYELFAQEIAKGKSATEAYVLAGYRPSRKNASRLRANEDVNARVRELQAASAQSHAITIESICRELDEANAVAKEKGQAAAMVSASALRAKLAGLMVEKVEVSTNDTFDGLETPEAIVDKLLAEECRFYPVTDRDKRDLLALFDRHWNERVEFIASIKARPVAALIR